jgi:hypothetical protein
MCPHHIGLPQHYQPGKNSQRSPRSHRILQIHNLQIRFVPQCANLSPKQWHAPSNLYKAKLGCVLIKRPLGDRIGFPLDKNKLLRLIEIGDVPFVVDSASEVARASAEARAAADEAEMHMATVDEGWADVEGYTGSVNLIQRPSLDIHTSVHHGKDVCAEL